jgi:hypothetical protein
LIFLRIELRIRRLLEPHPHRQVHSTKSSSVITISRYTFLTCVFHFICNVHISKRGDKTGLPLPHSSFDTCKVRLKNGKEGWVGDPLCHHSMKSWDSGLSVQANRFDWTFQPETLKRIVSRHLPEATVRSGLVRKAPCGFPFQVDLPHLPHLVWVHSMQRPISYRFV